MRAGTQEKVHAEAHALRPLVGPTLEALQQLITAAGAEDLVHRLGHLYVYRSAQSLRKDHFAWELRRENGVEIDEFDADELRQLEPALSRDYVRGVLVRENGHTSNPLKLVERLLEHFLRSGGELVHARAHGFRLDGGIIRAAGLRMAFVPGYEQDVFISYAHVDDVPFFGGADPDQAAGWVTRLVRHLENFLAQQVGCAEGFRVWKDNYNLRGNDALTPEIAAELQRAATSSRSCLQATSLRRGAGTKRVCSRNILPVISPAAFLSSKRRGSMTLSRCRRG